MKFKLTRNLALIATSLALLLTLLGSYTRLADVSYLSVETLHQFVSAILGLVIAAIVILAWKQKKKKRHPVMLATFLFVFVILQAVIGFWSATMDLNPVFVMLHLLSGFILTALSFTLAIRLAKANYPFRIRKDIVENMAPWTVIGLIILSLEITLGLWTSATQSSLVCNSVASLPICQGDWVSLLNFKDAFQIWNSSYLVEGLEQGSKITIHVVHRIGAIVTLLYLGWLAWRLNKLRNYLLADLGKLLGIVLLLQFLLGIGNVIFSVPQLVAVAHNGFSVLLLLSLTAVNFVLWAYKRRG